MIMPFSSKNSLLQFAASQKRLSEVMINEENEMKNFEEHK